MRYLRLPHLLEDLFAKLMDSYAKTDLLILDWGLVPLTAEQRRDMLELLDDRSMPVDKWHELIVDPTLADAILDRLVHNASCLLTNSVSEFGSVDVSPVVSKRPDRPSELPAPTS